MGTENLPFTGTQSLHNGGSLQGAQFGIRIYRGHQNGGILIVGGLLFRQTMDVDINIAGKSDMVSVVDQDDLTGQMAALTFINFKVQFPKVEETDLTQRLCLLCGAVPKDSDLLWIHGAVSGQSLAHIDVRPVERILFPESVLAFIFQLQALGGLLTSQDFIKPGQ